MECDEVMAVVGSGLLFVLVWSFIMWAAKRR